MRVTLVTTLVIAFLATGCGGPPVSHYQALQDGLSIPSDWQRVTETIAAPGASITCASILPGCPRVSRYYSVPGTPADAYAQGKQMLTGAGFAIDHDSSDCLPPPASPACGMSATRDGDRVEVNAYNPGDDPELVAAPADRTMVRINASPKGGSGDVGSSTS
jgi:hypothetical protein